MSNRNTDAPHSGRLDLSASTLSRFAFWFLLLAGLAACSAMAQDRLPQTGAAQNGSPVVTAFRVSVPPDLDGLLTEEIWLAAAPAAGFLQKDPQEGAPASERTEVRILFDSQTLYIGVICYDSDPGGIRATELRRDDELQNDDLFEMILDTFHDHRNGYLFRINPLGTQYDATVTNEGQTMNENWDEKWDSRTQITQEGWTAEIAIPFKTLRFSNSDEIIWGVNFHRTIKRKNEDVFWTAHSRSYEFEEVSQAGHLEGLSQIQSFTFRFKPFVTSGAGRSIRRGIEETRQLHDVGIEDVKYMVTPQLALDLTVNPDFAQADVDEAQVNLTRFNLFFPERREFFQEGSGIFQFGARPPQPWQDPQLLVFHSRRIGLSDNRQEIPIRAGLKLTGKQGPFDLGALNMQTGREGDIRGQNFTVLRAKGNLLERSYVGAIFTRNTSNGALDGSWVGGLDANFTFLQNLNVQGFLAKSGSHEVGAGEWAGLNRVEWDSDRFQFLAERLDIQESFQPQMGFVSRAEPDWRGLRKSTGGAAYKPRPPIPGVRQLEFGALVEHLANQDGLLETRLQDFEWSVEFESGEQFQFSHRRNFERLVRPFRIRQGGTIPAGDYAFGEYMIRSEAFRGRAISGGLNLRWGEFFDGSRRGIEVSPQIKPTANLSFEPSYEWNRITLPNETFTTQEMNTVVNYSFNQQWLTQTTFLVNSQDYLYAMNFRLNYIFRPGDDIFFVYNEARSYGDTEQFLDRALIFKMTFSLDR